MGERAGDIGTEKNKRKTVICRSCSAEYDASIPNCPYCGTMNLPAAETAYMNKLEGIRGNLEALQSLGKTETRAHMGRLSKKVLIAAAVLMAAVAIVFGVRLLQEKKEAAAEQAEYLWQREGFAQMDAYYAAGDYDELTAYYLKASDEGHRMWQYKHRDFCEYYNLLSQAQSSLRSQEETGGDRLFLFIDEVSLYRLEAMTHLSQEERALLEGLRQPLLEDFNQRFPLSQEELDGFRQMLNQNGFVSLEACERLFKERGWEE